MDYLKIAAAGAKKICRKDCLFGIQCGYTDKAPKPCFKPWAGKLEKCPLEKYQVEHEQNPPPWWERPVGEVQPSKDELFSLCAACPNGSIVQDPDGEFMHIEPDDFDKCMDCPVEHVRESIEEAEAEAACS